MRLPRSLRRLIDPHTAVITGVKSALRAGDGDQMAHLLRSHRRRLGLSSGQTETLSAALVGRLDDSVSHGEASEQLDQLGQSVPASALTATTWLTLENLSRTVGCFAASYRFSQRARERMHSSGTPRMQFLAALHSQDQETSARLWRAHGQSASGFWAEAGHYLWLWSRGDAGAFLPSPDMSFVSAVSNRPVTILGPAPTDLTAESLAGSALVARVIMQRVLSWDEQSDPLGGACQLAYASRETRNWIRDTDSWAELDRFDVVSFRLDANADAFPASAAVLRHAHDPRALMPGGSSPNMIPLMLWDLSRVPGVQLTLGGTTFFASATAYTEGNRRLKHTTGRDTDATGSTGELFERCPTFARHNVTENLTLVANLITSGAISADTPTREVASMSVPGYLATLDELYGKQRA